MDTAAPAADEHLVGNPLAAEIRASALLIGSALGLMGSFALLLLFVTTAYGR